MIEPILANSLHEKQLPPHLRKRRGGQSVYYAEFSSQAKELTYQGIAAESLEENTFGYVENGLVYKAGVNIDKPANCYVVETVDANDVVNYVVSGRVASVNGQITTFPYLGYSGNVATTPPQGNFEQVLGIPIGSYEFIVSIQNPIWNE